MGTHIRLFLNLWLQGFGRHKPNDASEKDDVQLYNIYRKIFRHVGLAQSLLAAFPYEIFTLESSSSQLEKQHMASVLQCSQCTTVPSFLV